MALDDVFTDDFESGDPIDTNWDISGFGDPEVAAGVGRGGGYGVQCAGASQSGRLRNATAFVPGTRTGIAQWDLWLSSDGLSSIGDDYWFSLVGPGGVGHQVGVKLSGASAPYDVTPIGYTTTMGPYAGVVPGGQWVTLRASWVLSSAPGASDGEFRIYAGDDEDSLVLIHEEVGIQDLGITGAAYVGWAYTEFEVDLEGFLDNITVGTGVPLPVVDRFATAWTLDPEGTVTHETGDLEANQLVLGAGADDLKTVPATQDGQIPIGRVSDGAMVLARPTAGANVTITYGPGSLEIASAAGAATPSYVPMTTGAEPLEIMSDGAGNVLLIAYEP